MKATLCVLALFIGAVVCWTPPQAPKVGSDWSFMGLNMVYMKDSGKMQTASSWIYGDSANQRTAIVQETRDSNVGVIADAVKQEVFIADYYKLVCDSQAGKVEFVGPDFYQDYRFIGQLVKPEFAMCGKCDGFELIKDNVVTQTWFVAGTNIPCYEKTDTTSFIDEMWYIDFKYNTTYGPDSFMEVCPFKPSTSQKLTAPMNNRFYKL